MTPSHARLHDQFYTDRPLADRLLRWTQAWLAEHRPALRPCYLEPSAGDGAFLNGLPKPWVALDIDPKDARIEAGDFLTWVPPPLRRSANGWVAVGNPPFGKNASLAVKFFNRAATFAEVIAFIVPRTFEKHSVQHRLDERFHLQHQEVLPLMSFRFEGEPCPVPCVFQLWAKADIPRAKPMPVRAHPDFAFTTVEQADFAFQRVGAAAGKVKALDAPNIAAASHYFVAVTRRAQVRAVQKRLASIDWRHIKERTAGNPSISKAELVAAYTEALSTKA